MKKAAKIFLWIFIVFSLLFVGLYFGSQPLLKGIIDDKLKDTRIAGLYKIKAQTAYFDLFNLGISLKDVQLTPDTTAKAFKLSPQIVVLHIKRVSLSNVNPVELIKNNELKIGKIKVIQPDLNLYFLNRNPPPKKELAQSSTPNFNLDGFEIRKMKVNLHLKNGSSISIDHLNLKIDHPNIKPDLLPDLTQAITYKDIEISLKNIALINSKSDYNIGLKGINIDKNFKSIMVRGIKIEPKYDKLNFAKRHPYQTDRFVIDLDKIELLNFDLTRFLTENIISIQNINITDLDMEVYRDKGFPLNSHNHPQLPQQQIRGIKQLIEIENINLQKANIVYLEKMNNSSKAGRVDFKNLQAQITHFGNTDEWIQNEEFRVNAQTNIYGNIPLYAQLNFPLGSNTFYVSGQIKSAPMHYFNAITKNNAGVEIKKGKIDKIDFNFKAHNQSSTGDIKFLYNNLEIEIQKEKESGEIKGRKFINFLVNSIFLPKQNPNKKGEEYHGIIKFDRDPNKGIFNYLWKSVFSGIKDTFLKDNKDVQDYTIEKEEAKKSQKELRQQQKSKRKKKRQLIK